MCDEYNQIKFLPHYPLLMLCVWYEIKEDFERMNEGSEDGYGRESNHQK